MGARSGRSGKSGKSGKSGTRRLPQREGGLPRPSWHSGKESSRGRTAKLAPSCKCKNKISWRSVVAINARVARWKAAAAVTHSHPDTKEVCELKDVPELLSEHISGSVQRIGPLSYHYKEVMCKDGKERPQCQKITLGNDPAYVHEDVHYDDLCSFQYLLHPPYLPEWCEYLTYLLS